MSVQVVTSANTVRVIQDGNQVMELTWPEANKLQADLRHVCTAAGITLRDAAL